MKEWELRKKYKLLFGIYTWNLLAIWLESACNQYFPPGICLQSGWNLLAINIFHLESTWNLSGICLQSIFSMWNLLGICLESAWNQCFPPGIYLESVWNLLAINIFQLESTWNLLGICLQSIFSSWNLPGIFPGICIFHGNLLAICLESACNSCLQYACNGAIPRCKQKNLQFSEPRRGLHGTHPTRFGRRSRTAA